MNTNKNKIEYKINLTEDTQSLLKKLPQINSDDVNILYENETYDGPEEGLSKWNNEKYYFKVFDFANGKLGKKYFLIKLTQDQLENDEKLHEEFLEMKNWEEFHENVSKYPEQEINENQLVGWFVIFK